jgi:hypothetical protein
MKPGCAVTGVGDENVVGVSGYTIVNGPGVWVRSDGNIEVSPDEEVTNRNDVGLAVLIAVFGSIADIGAGFAVLGEDNSIAAA